MKYRCHNPYCQRRSETGGSCPHCYGPALEPIHGSALAEARKNLHFAVTGKLPRADRAPLPTPRKKPVLDTRPYSKPTVEYAKDAVFFERNQR